ncbi:hypothetical protein DENSPDRAFT_886477 [Dentipellis sp. KUC8613]|nr:hypothetical protein DENSPDRAFT_886477 [Dentipellis sp. KUC8613]
MAALFVHSPPCVPQKRRSKRVSTPPHAAMPHRMPPSPALACHAPLAPSCAAPTSAHVAVTRLDSAILWPVAPATCALAPSPHAPTTPLHALACPPHTPC